MDNGYAITISCVVWAYYQLFVGSMYAGMFDPLVSVSILILLLGAGGESVRIIWVCNIPRLINLQTSGSVQVFFIAMALHPEIQSRAQKEIDTIIGSERLPTITDRHALPYVDALVKEVMRWHPILPLSAWSGATFHHHLRAHYQ